jgi:hypothetical protein
MQRKNWEVIEFPSVILNTKTLKVSTFCPTENSQKIIKGTSCSLLLNNMLNMLIGRVRVSDVRQASHKCPAEPHLRRDHRHPTRLGR